MDHLTQLEQGIEHWNRWRSRYPEKACSLEGKDLSHGFFFEGNFVGVNLRGANLQRACLVGANFQDADLTGADLSGAYLGDANFSGANLANANFTKTTLERADMRGANLLGTQLEDADIRTTKLPDPKLDSYESELTHLLAQSTQTAVAEPKANVAPAKAVSDRKAKALQKRKAKSRARRQAKALERSETQALPTKAAKPLPQKTATAPKGVAAEKSSLLHRITAPIKTPLNTLNRKAPASELTWDQQVRLSALPVRSSQARQRTAFNPFQPKPPSPKVAQPAKQKLAKQDAAQWGRRQSDQRLAALMGHQVRQKQSWVPAIAAAGIAVAVGVPFAIPSIVNSQQQVAADSVTTLALTKSLTGTGQIQAIATHTPSNGNMQVIVGAANGNIEILDGQTGETLQTLTTQNERDGEGAGIQAIAMSDSGQWLVSSSSTGLSVWNPETGQLIHTLPTQSETIAAVEISPDERTFISSDEEGNISAWDIASGQQRYHVNSGDAVWDIAIAPDSKSFVSSGHRLRQWDLATGSVMQSFTGHRDDVRSVAISPDGKTLASGSWDQTIKLWSLASGDLQTTLSGHTDQVASLAISADGKTLASSSSDRTLKLWDLPSRQLTKTLDSNTDDILTVAFAPSSSATGQALVSGSRQAINVWQ